MMWLDAFVYDVGVYMDHVCACMLSLILFCIFLGKIDSILAKTIFDCENIFIVIRFFFDSAFACHTNLKVIDIKTGYH